MLNVVTYISHIPFLLKYNHARKISSGNFLQKQLSHLESIMADGRKYS